MNLGKRLTILRKENKMSQEEFSEIFNVTRQTISNWENSKSYPDIETVVKISDYFNISLDILLKEDKTMIQEIDKKIKKNKQFKWIIGILGTTIFFVFILLLAMYLFPEKFEHYDKMGEAMVMYKVDDNRTSDYHILYNKIFKYPDPRGGVYGVVSEKEKNVSKKLQNMPKFKNIQDHINYVKKLYEEEGMEVIVTYFNNWDEASDKYMELYELLNPESDNN